MMGWGKIWNDPVWSNVIAGTILLVGSSAWGILRHQTSLLVLLLIVIGLAFVALGFSRRPDDGVRAYSGVLKLDRGCERYEVFYPVNFVKSPNLTIRGPMRDYKLEERADGFAIKIRTMLALPFFDRERDHLLWTANGIPRKE
jgi:hypothetical protein